MKIYLAGPMRGIPEFNFPAFHAAAAKLRADGHFVFSPAERDLERHGTDVSAGNLTGCEIQAEREHDLTIRVALGDDMAWICAEAEAIALLPGWHDSKGARAEFATATALGLQVIELDGGEPVRPAGRYLEADSAARKRMPVSSGVLDYFPDAMAAVAEVSWHGNEKHNPGQPLHWARGKSMDHADCIARHLIERGGFDGPIRHSAALAWRALALLQEELEAERGFSTPRGAKDVA